MRRSRSSVSVPPRTVLRMKARPSGAAIDNASAERSLRLRRRSFNAISAAARMSVPQGLSGELQEHGFEVRLDDLDAGNLGPGRGRRREDERKALAGARDDEIEAALA